VRHTRGIHKDVDFAKLAQDGIMERLQRWAVENVARDARRSAAEGFDFAGDRVDLLDAARAGNHVGTALSEAQRDGVTESRGAAGYNCHAAGEIKQTLAHQ
jgi:hypothetical protein